MSERIPALLHKLEHGGEISIDQPPDCDHAVMEIKAMGLTIGVSLSKRDANEIIDALEYIFAPAPPADSGQE